MPKATRAADARRLTDIPNIGPAMAGDLRLLGIDAPPDLHGQDPVALYLRLCRLTEARHDPCVLDTLMAAVAFVEHDDARPWWAFTEQRKQGWAAVEAALPARLRRAGA
jgi:hypothetical protein